MIIFIIDEFQSVYMRAIKEMLTLYKYYGCNNFGVIVNRAISKKHGYETYNRFNKSLSESNECLKTTYIHSVVQDVKVKDCNLNKELVQQKFPDCDYSISVNDIAKKVSFMSKVNIVPGGSIKFISRIS